MLINSIQTNQFVRSETLLGYIIPLKSQMYAQANLAQKNFSKIDTGLQVQIGLDAYPYQEYGYINGTVSYVSSIASDTGFFATIKLDRGLLTSTNKRLLQISGLNGEAVIIAKKMRLSEKLYYKLIKDFTGK